MNDCIEHECVSVLLSGKVSGYFHSDFVQIIDFEYTALHYTALVVSASESLL